MLRRLVPIVAAGLLACAPKASDPAAAEKKAAPAVTEGCAEAVAGMRALFAQAPEALFVVPLSEGMKLPTSSQGAAVEPGLAVHVQADGSYEFMRQPKASIEALREELTEEFEKESVFSERLGRPFSPRLALVADARAPAAAVLALGALVPPETHYTLTAELAGDTVPPHPPYPPALVDVLENAAADARSSGIARLLEPAIGACEPLKQVFSDVATTTSDKRTTALLSGLPDAVEQCRCEGIDLEMLIGAVWAMAGKTETYKRALALALSFDAGAEEVVLPGAATVTDLVRLAEQRGPSPFRLVLRD